MKIIALKKGFDNVRIVEKGERLEFDGKEGELPSWLVPESKEIKPKPTITSRKPATSFLHKNLNEENKKLAVKLEKERKKIEAEASAKTAAELRSTIEAQVRAEYAKKGA